jgi:hypothetical protein
VNDCAGIGKTKPTTAVALFKAARFVGFFVLVRWNRRDTPDAEKKTPKLIMLTGRQPTESRIVPAASLRLRVSAVQIALVPLFIQMSHPISSKGEQKGNLPILTNPTFPEQNVASSQNLVPLHFFFAQLAFSTTHSPPAPIPPLRKIRLTLPQIYTTTTYVDST